MSASRLHHPSIQASGQPIRFWYDGMGACFDCLVTVDGRASQRACLTKASEGAQVRSAMPAGTADDPLVPLVPEPHEAADVIDTEVLVVGAGPAGLSAALAAAQAGARVTVLDERPQSGGQFFKPLAPSHAAATPADAQFAQGLALARAVRDAGVQVIQEAQVWAAFSPQEVGAVIGGRAGDQRGGQAGAGAQRQGAAPVGRTRRWRAPTACRPASAS